MLSAGYIESENRRAARKASHEHVKPYIFEESDRASLPPFPFPFIGNLRPKGWELVDTLFVDISGFGDDNESTLSNRQLIKRLRPGYGYALIEVGQFQGYLGEFVPPFAAKLARQDLGIRP